MKEDLDFVPDLQLVHVIAADQRLRDPVASL
jgi:hypothetical protein